MKGDNFPFLLISALSKKPGHYVLKIIVHLQVGWLVTHWFFSVKDCLNTLVRILLDALFLFISVYFNEFLYYRTLFFQPYDLSYRTFFLVILKSKLSLSKVILIVF